eukprot:m.367769 g.367769  ORF g.367769 m.367769 type:complete len:70 (+) comp42345_c0_seq1:88-297(+)
MFLHHPLYVTCDDCTSLVTVKMLFVLSSVPCHDITETADVQRDTVLLTTKTQRDEAGPTVNRRAVSTST